MISRDQYHQSKGTAYVTIEQVWAIHGEQAARRLIYWMRGQTQGLAENGEAMIYAWDYERWLDATPIVD